jgi:hypothetical protein
MAKLTAAGLALPVAAAFLGRRPRWGAAVPAAAAALLIAAPWVALNLHLYGQILPSDATRQLLGAVFPSRPGAAALAASLKNAFTTFWAGEPHRELPVPELTTSLMALWLAAAAVGAWRLRRPPRVFGLLLLAVVGEIGWAIATLSFSGVGGAIPGRYLYPAAPAICVLAAAGIGEVLRNASLQVVAFGLYSAAAAINLGGLPLGFTGLPAPDRTAPSPGSTAYAVSAAAGFAGVTVAADRVLADSTQGCIWIHLSAVNRSGGPVDWWPVLYLHVGGSKHAVESSYGRSTAFPDTLDPGERVTGWVEAPVSPAELRRPVDAYMVDIAADGYRRVGEVKLVLAA